MFDLFLAFIHTFRLCLDHGLVDSGLSMKRKVKGKPEKEMEFLHTLSS